MEAGAIKVFEGAMYRIRVFDDSLEDKREEHRAYWAVKDALGILDNRVERLVKIIENENILSARSPDLEEDFRLLKNWLERYPKQKAEQMDKTLRGLAKKIVAAIFNHTLF